ncbi:hypothetical protein [Nocardia suismassiliense]|uniref:hypothetical protein n=1 Tax=Nocardia suismassiliense TaxID=2077092 RepID=UPI000D1F25B5|nr:hypothetical protein [Nocardia suismassiliense]
MRFVGWSVQLWAAVHQVAAHTGRIITAAALILLVVTGAAPPPTDARGPVARINAALGTGLTIRDLDGTTVLLTTQYHLGLGPESQ